MKWSRRVRVYSPGDVAIAQAALDLHHSDPVAAVGMLDSARLNVDDLVAMTEQGLIADCGEPAPDVEEAMLDVPSGLTTEATGLSVTLPDGTDLTDPRIQSVVAEHVTGNHGPHAVVMWPRHPDVEDGVAPVVPVVLARPRVTEPIALSPAARPTDAPAVARHLAEQGLDLVEFSPRRGFAVGAVLTDEQRAIRDRLATIIQRPSNAEDLRPWEVEVAVHHVIDDGVKRLDQVVILRMQEASADADKRLALLRALVGTLPGGSDGWEVIDDLVTGTARLRYGKPRTLPERVAMADLLPPALDLSDWARIPLGVDPAGRVAFIDLTAGPHSLVVGPTGSGKSVYLRQHAVSALARGHQLVVIDPVKSGLDFLAFKPWCVAFADDGIEQARAAIEAVYAEGMRRKELLRRYEAPSWIDLPPEVRRSENIAPLTVLFDEFMSAVISSPVPKGLDKDDPLVEEANRINAAKSVILAMVGKIARELRFVGVFLVVAMQRPDASLLQGFGEIRSNLTSAAQLVKPGSLPAQETLRMVFPGDQTQVAADTIRELDDGESKGLATIAADGGDVQGFRVGFGAPSEILGLLAALGVPEPRKWTITGPEEAPKPFSPIVPSGGPSRPLAPGSAGPTVQPKFVDIGEFELSLDALELEGDTTSDLDEFDFDERPAMPSAVRVADEDDEIPALPAVPKPRTNLSDLF